MKNPFAKFFGEEEPINLEFGELAKPTPSPNDLPESGRSSIEEQQTFSSQQAGFSAFFNNVDPLLPFDFIDFLWMMSMVNPAISQAVHNYVNIANPGHNVTVDGPDAAVEMAIKRINEKAALIYQRGVGVDGLINHMVTQIAITGASSWEDIISPRLDGVIEVVPVPVSRIRFLYEGGSYMPYQQVVNITNLRGATVQGNLNKLNPITYAYYAWHAMENSPYARLPFSAAILPVLREHRMFESIDFIMKKFGLVGLVNLIITPSPRKPGEADEEYRARLKREAKDVLTTIEKNYYKAVMVSYKDQELKHYNFAGEANGAKDLFDKNEEQLFSGMSAMPAMHGRSMTYGETYGMVLYNILLRDSENLQRLPKRRLERTYGLDLQLAGVAIDGVSLSFDKNQSLKPAEDATAAKTKTEDVILKVKNGYISPDEGAQELGYDGAYDPELAYSAPDLSTQLLSEKRKLNEKGKVVFLRFDRSRQQYIHRPEVVELKKKELSS